MDGWIKGWMNKWVDRWETVWSNFHQQTLVNRKLLDFLHNFHSQRFCSLDERKANALLHRFVLGFQNDMVGMQWVERKRARAQRAPSACLRRRDDRNDRITKRYWRVKSRLLKFQALRWRSWNPLFCLETKTRCECFCAWKVGRSGAQRSGRIWFSLPVTIGSLIRDAKAVVFPETF